MLPEQEYDPIPSEKVIPRRVIEEEALADQILTTGQFSMEGKEYQESEQQEIRNRMCSVSMNRHVKLFKPGTKVIFPPDERGVRLIKIVPGSKRWGGGCAVDNISAIPGIHRYFGPIPKCGYRFTLSAWWREFKKKLAKTRTEED